MPPRSSSDALVTIRAKALRSVPPATQIYQAQRTFQRASSTFATLVEPARQIALTDGPDTAARATNLFSRTMRLCKLSLRTPP